jgi:hypothetical protein
MSTQSPEPADATETRGGTTDRQSRPKRALSTVRRRDEDGTLASLAGGLLLTAAARSALRQRRRSGVLAVLGVALLGVGIGRRRSAGSADAQRYDTAGATAHGTGSDLVGPSQTNPRGVSGETAVGADADRGDVQFTTGGADAASGPKPHLDPADPEDPRYADADDPETAGDHVEVSLSETKMTDELGQVAGPDEEQAYPASEGTDPEPMADEAPERYGQGAVGNKGTDGPGGERETGAPAADEDEIDDRAATDDADGTDERS